MFGLAKTDAKIQHLLFGGIKTILPGSGTAYLSIDRFRFFWKNEANWICNHEIKLHLKNYLPIR